MSECQSLSERPDSLNLHNYPTDQSSSSHHRRNNRIRGIACLLLLTLIIITFVTILVIGITHNIHLVVQPNSTTELNSSLTESQVNKTNITVYYEVLNSESKRVIVNQLVPVQNKYGSYINIRYVPFGKVTISREIQGNYHYQCNPNHIECHAAKLHACLQQKFSNYTDQTQLTSIIACTITKYGNSGTTMDKITKRTVDCMNEYTPGESTQSIVCSNAELLIDRNHDEAMRLQPPMKFLPTVMVDGIQVNQDQMLKDMDDVVCNAIKRKIEIIC